MFTVLGAPHPYTAEP